MCEKIIITDLKPENTLFDTVQREVFMIDMGGYLELNEDETEKKFLINSHSYTYTE